MPETTFNRPLNEWSEEEIDVTVVTPRMSLDGKRLEKLESHTEKATQKTMFLKEEVAFQSCKDGNHYWILKDPNRFAFECRKCNLGKFAKPWEYTWEDGKLIKLQ